MLQKGALDGLIFFQDKNEERYNYEYHISEKFDLPYKTCGANSCNYYGGHSVSSTPSTDEKDENDDELLQKYLGDTIWEDQDDFVKNDETVDPCLFQERAEPNYDLLRPKGDDFLTNYSIKRTSTSISHTAPSFLQPKKRRKKQGGMRSHLASTLNFPYKEELSSRSSVKEGIWQDQGDQAEMFEKHFNSAWQCQFMIDFYGIGGTCHSYHNGDTNRWNLKREENHFEISKKENNAKLFNRDLSKDTSLNSNMVSPAFDDKGNLVHSCRETKQRDQNLNDGIYCYTEEDLKSARVKLIEAMDLTDDSRTKVFRIEESMNINRTKYLSDIRMMK